MKTRRPLSPRGKIVAATLALVLAIAALFVPEAARIEGSVPIIADAIDRMLPEPDAGSALAP